MDISKKDLLEMNIVDIHDKMVERMKPRSCRLLYDFIEGNLNKENIREWAGLQVSQIFNLKLLLKVANKENIEKTIQIIQNSNSKEDAAKKLMDVLGLDEIGARCVVDQRLSALTGIRIDAQKECIEFFEKRLSIVKELAKYDR